MSFTQTDSRVQYLGDDSTEVYAYDFEIDAQAELLVYVRDTLDPEADDILLVLTTDYTVSGVNSGDGGNVTLVDDGQDWLDGDGDLATGWRLVIQRNIPLTQTSAIRNVGSFNPATHETVWDRIVRIIQQIFEYSQRSVRLPFTVTPAEFNPVLPANIAGAESKLPVTNEDGDGFAPIEDWPTLGNLAAAGDSAVEAAASAAAAAASAAAALASEVAAAASAATASAAALLNTPQITGTRAAPIDIVAGTGIAFVGSYWFNKWFIKGTGGVVVIANPQIAAGTVVGQRLTLQGTNDTDYVDFSDGTGLVINGLFRAIASATLDIEWDGTNWVQIGRSDL